MGKGLPYSNNRSKRFLEVRSFAAGSPAVGATNAVMAAFTDDGKFHRFYNKTVLWTGNGAQRVTATFGGTAADIKAIQVVVIGTDSAGDPLT
jgi:hypothetical protein